MKRGVNLLILKEKRPESLLESLLVNYQKVYLKSLLGKMRF